MKILNGLMIVTAALFIAATPQRVQAQQYGGTAFASLTGSAALDGGTNTVPALSTNSYYIPLNKYGDVALDLSFKAHTSGSTSNLVFNIWESATTNKPTVAAARYAIPVAATSTTIVRPPTTNFTVNSVGYLIVEVANTNASGLMTNVSGMFYTKPKRFGN